MASDAAHSELDDILLSLDHHLISTTASDPEPVDVHAPNLDPASRSTTPEPPDEHELLAVRTRALSIRDEKGKGRGDSSWNELVNMVLRLTAAVPARTQVMEQAATIRRLSIQQEFLMRRIDDERAIWDAERNGMHRVCEALIAQANIASHNLYKEQENSKKPVLIEAENTSLRQKLADAQSRISSLEAELAQLRPLLLMQPSAIALSRGITLPTGRPRRREESMEAVENRSYYRVREEKAVASSPKSRKKKALAYFKHAPTVADARSEHLLLAARKLGKERASLLSQAMYRTADPQGPSTAPNHDLTMHIKNTVNLSRPMMSPAVWPNHVQQSAQNSQQPNRQQGQQSGGYGPAKGTQNPPFSQFGPPSNVTYSHPQQYFMPSGSVGRPGTAMPAPTFYHAPPRGYIPGPAWPYYTPGPYAFGQPIAIQNAGPNANTSPTRPATSPPVAGPSRTPAPSTPQGTPATPARNATEPDPASNQGQKPLSKGQQEKAQKRPQSKSAANASSTRNPPTPMDSLLSAARSIFSPDSSSGSHAADDEGSPSPKKRRRVDELQGLAVSQSNEKPSAASETPNNPGRQASALDVLADQAAGVVPSSGNSGSGSVNRGAEVSTSTENTQPISRLRKRKQPQDTSTPGTSETTVPEAHVVPATRRGKRPIRASSTSPVTRSSSSLAPPMTAQRAASEEQPSSANLKAQQDPAGSFRLRPVQPSTFAEKDMPAVRATSLPRTGPSAVRKSVGREREPNSRNSVTRARTASAEADIDAEGDEVESEDDDDAKDDQLEHSASLRPPVSEKKDVISSSGEDMNSRRWLEILGRKDG